MRRRSRAGCWDAQLMAEGLEIVASGLRAGLPAGPSLRLVTESTEWGRAEHDRIARVADQVGSGETLGSAWCVRGDSEAAAEAYRLLGAVWDLAMSTGAPLAEALDVLAHHLREEARIRGRLDALASGPRASQRLLTLLPVLGPVLALMVGASPLTLYGSLPGVLSLGVGGALAVVGWRWGRSLVATALRPRTYAVVTKRDPSG